MSWIRAWICAAVVALGALGHEAVAEPARQQAEPTFIQIRPTRLYRLIYRRPRDPSRFYYLLGRPARREVSAGSMPRVKLPMQGASLQWNPRYGGR